ncbi:pleiotropic drug resistance protein 1-like isoform X2 [Rutidosis leptorrhynchoides]|uniref:pleiotropic drug resistance protein 1-like isoform X2 n=1 Tax=Rutidosis leptorrhynchoides TaxID=125765 RepID=UPI003A991BE2
MEGTSPSFRSFRGSFRTNSASIWRDGGGAVAFSSSLRRDERDDEEALKWAAIERLPTVDRVRKGLLNAIEGETSEVDITKLGFQDRKDLIERLVNDTDVDNERFLMKLRRRLDRVGIEIPTLDVRFENLRVEAEAQVGSRALPSFTNFSINMVEGLLQALHLYSSQKRHLNILQGISGRIKPSRLTLLLGPPGSGKTTFLLALAGRLDKDLSCSGKITYNGHGIQEFVAQRTAAYISQHDLHVPEMTVRETLAFSARCQGVGNRFEMLAELSRREKEANIMPDPDLDIFMKSVSIEGQESSVITEYILKVLGLEICADTMVGDDMIRGISGGQKKRVTTGEMLVGPARLFLMDEISTGLDSSTTYQIVNMLKQYIHIFKGTTVISLLQPPPETYKLFDDIILLSDGQIVYQGPRENILEFFESMGFKCPERKGEADFLQEVTSKKDQQQYWVSIDRPYNYISVKEFADAFQSFHVGRGIQQELATPFDKSKEDPTLLTTKKYGVTTNELMKACFSREFLLMKRNSLLYIFKILQLMIMSLIGSTLFLRVKMHKDTVTDAVIYMGSLFFTVVMLTFNGMAEIPLVSFKLPVFYKQRDLLFFPAWANVIPQWILCIPVSFIEALVWVVISYYTVGYDPDATRFFKQWLLLGLLNMMATTLFRVVASIGRNMTISTTLGSFAMCILFVNCGYVLSRDKVKKWWIWAYWISPLMYADAAIYSNEFLGDSWSKIDPATNETLGVTVMKSRAFFPHEYWYWIGVGALIVLIIILNGLFTIFLTLLNAYDKQQAVLLEPEINENSNSERGAVDLTSQEYLSTGQSSSAAVQPTEERNRGMILPFEPHSLSFDNVTYSVDMPQAMKAQGVTDDTLMLLRGVSGSFRPGVLTALMGVSGAGKTTLMDVLAGRKTGGYIDGNISISGYIKKQETFARISGYCEQNDIHSPYVTVHESLMYSAWLRLSPDVDADTRKRFVEEVMELVELESLRGAIVGLPGVSGLSTEQRKRLTIAVELVANPSIIFMDEPTSGLDARAAAIVMRTVRNTVDTGRTVVCTIHQPSIDIFEAFDELFLLKRGGQEIYVGPLGQHSCELIKYFESIEGVPKIREGVNPATWMLEVTTTSQEAHLGVDFTEIYQNSELYRRNKEVINELSIPTPGSKDLYFKTQYSQPFLTQCMACLWKQRLSYWRNPPYTAIRFYYTLIVAFAFGTMFWDLGNKMSSMKDLSNAMGSMHAAVLFVGTLYAGGSQPIVSIERIVFYRETAAGMYSALPYAVGQVLVEIPYVMIQGIMYSVVVYSMMGFEWTVAKFFWYVFFFTLSLLYFTFYGMLTVAVTPTFPTAVITSSAFFAIWNLFTGFIVPRSHIPVWWRWYYWACPLAWTLYGLFASQYGDKEEMVEDIGQTVKEFLYSYYGYKHNFLGVVAVVSLAFPVFFAVIFAVCIKIFNFQNR